MHRNLYKNQKKCNLNCFGILATSSTSFVIFTSSILVCIVIQEKEQNNQALNVLGVVLINYGQFLARMCLVLFLVTSKKFEHILTSITKSKFQDSQIYQFCSCINAGKNNEVLRMKHFLCVHVTKSLLLHKFEKFQICLTI